MGSRESWGLGMMCAGWMLFAWCFIPWRRWLEREIPDNRPKLDRTPEVPETSLEDTILLLKDTPTLLKQKEFCRKEPAGDDSQRGLLTAVGKLSLFEGQTPIPVVQREAKIIPLVSPMCEKPPEWGYDEKWRTIYQKIVAVSKHPVFQTYEREAVDLIFEELMAEAQNGIPGEIRAQQIFLRDYWQTLLASKRQRIIERQLNNTKQH